MDMYIEAEQERFGCNEGLSLSTNADILEVFGNDSRLEKTLEKDQVFKDYYGLKNTVPLKHRITIVSPIEYAQLEFTYDHE